MLAKAAGVSLRSVQRILNVFELLGELRIVAQLERADAVRRELVGLPSASMSILPPTPSSSQSMRRARSKPSTAPSRAGP
jgi:hypothetical protein